MAIKISVDLKPFEEKEKAIDRGTLAWAPCVIPKDDDFYMFYGPSPTSLAVSFDMFEWYNYPVKLNGEIPMAAHRDHFVLKLEDNKYIMYIVGTKNKKSCVSLFESSNLLEWDFCGYALTSGDDAPLNPPWGAMESPFVVKMDELYYLFVTYGDEEGSYNIRYARSKNALPIIRTHSGPYNPNRLEALKEYNSWCVCVQHLLPWLFRHILHPVQKNRCF